VVFFELASILLASLAMLRARGMLLAALVVVALSTTFLMPLW